MSELVSTIAYRHPKKEGMFLMVAEEVIWKDLPSELQTLFADKQEVVRFEMTSSKKLARVNGELVYQALRDQGYFVQMPPADLHSLYAAEEAWITQKEASHLL
jgi:uncharacterized protein YcgL (UPF0745 family)